MEGLRVLPNSVDLHYSFGVLYEKTDRFDQSISAMRTVLKLDPDHADALNFIGYMYADRGIHLDEAETMIRRALELKPGSGYITDSLGWLYFKKNRLDEAIRYLKEASETQSEDATIFEHLGDAHVGAGQLREAMEAYGKAYQINPESESLKKKIERLRKIGSFASAR
jgi:predicted Zn-dependent protease